MGGLEHGDGQRRMRVFVVDVLGTIRNEKEVPHQNQWRKEQMANECVTMKVPKIKMEEDCWVINGQRITPE